MKHKKLKQLVILLLFFGLQASIAQTVLNVKVKTGAVSVFDLKNVKSITFPENNLILNMRDTRSIGFTRSDIRYLNFSTGTGIEPINSIGSTINIFPNPVNDVLHINFVQNESENHLVEIRSIDGKLIHTTILNSYENGISVTHLSRGLYFCRVLNENTWNTAKFIKQ
ncbi:MAG TPA: T9SS type A sorting domain-containing protein [Paludibacter sp.]|nr:T9SS type A sorting domain-containing protein [Paludibacter sp.]